MDNQTILLEIDALIALLGDEINIARPAEERAVVEKIRQVMENTREQRTGSARAIWETYLPYAARRCHLLTRLEEGWEDELEYFASENAQFWLDNASARLEQGDISAAAGALGNLLESARLLKHDRITQVDLLIQGLDLAVEINEKKRSIQLFEEADRLHRKYLAGGSDFAGTGWLVKIKKLDRRLQQYREKIRRYYQYAESVIVSVEAATAGDLERVIDYLQQSLPGRVKVTRKAKALDDPEHAGPERYRVRVKITLE